MSRTPYTPPVENRKLLTLGGTLSLLGLSLLFLAAVTVCRNVAEVQALRAKTLALSVETAGGLGLIFIGFLAMAGASPGFPEAAIDFEQPDAEPSDDRPDDVAFLENTGEDETQTDGLCCVRCHADNSGKSTLCRACGAELQSPVGSREA